MIWHSTVAFGCGKARSRSGKVISVAYYEPKGNIEGLFHDNVFPPTENCIDEEDNVSIKKNKDDCDMNLMFLLYVNVICIIVIIILVIVII